MPGAPGAVPDVQLSHIELKRCAPARSLPVIPNPDAARSPLSHIVPAFRVSKSTYWIDGPNNVLNAIRPCHVLGALGLTQVLQQTDSENTGAHCLAKFESVVFGVFIAGEKYADTRSQRRR